MSARIHRRPLTDLLLATLAAVDKPVGDGTIPVDGGWNGGGPNAPGSTFTPYVVLTALSAAPAAGTGAFDDPQGDWHMPYSCQSFGGARAQAEWMADQARDVFATLSKTIVDLGDANYKFQQVWTTSIGGNNRVPQTDPPYWSQQDGVSFWLAKRFT